MDGGTTEASGPEGFQTCAVSAVRLGQESGLTHASVMLPCVSVVPGAPSVFIDSEDCVG